MSEQNSQVHEASGLSDNVLEQLQGMATRIAEKAAEVRGDNVKPVFHHSFLTVDLGYPNYHFHPDDSPLSIEVELVVLPVTGENMSDFPAGCQPGDLYLDHVEVTLDEQMEQWDE
jgi:hypothetical protein